MLERLDPRVAVHPGYMLAHGDEEVMPTCLVSDWVSFVQHDTQHVDQALHIRRRDLEDSLEVQAQDDDPYAPGRVMPDGYWLIDTSPEEDAPSPIDTSATVILQYKTFRICICHIEQNVVCVPSLASLIQSTSDRCFLTMITAQDWNSGRRPYLVLLP